MAIKGLTDSGSGYAIVGHLRKGGPAVQKGNYKTFGQELSYFRFDPVKGEEQLAEVFRAEYGSEPRSLVVKLPYESLEANFEAWLESWGKTGLNARCDGENQVLWFDKQKGIYNRGSKPCAVIDGQCPLNCRAAGRLTLILPKLGRMARVMLVTHSKNDISEIYSNLAEIYRMRGNLTGIPFLLTRREREISAPNPKNPGERMRIKKWLCSIEVDPEWASLILSAQENLQRQALLEAYHRTSLPGGEQRSIQLLPSEIVDNNGFRPKNSKDGRNAERFKQLIQPLEMATEEIPVAIQIEFPNRHSSELSDVHCDRVVHRLLVIYTMRRLGVSQHEAQQVIDSLNLLPLPDRQKVEVLQANLDSQPTTVAAQVLYEPDSDDEIDGIEFDVLETEPLADI